MKRILIFQENTSAVEVYDDDDTELGEYTKEVSQILENANVSILKTSTSSVVLRPSKITSILVQPMEDPPVPDIDILVSPQEEKPIKAKEDHEDIITDAD